MQITISGMTGNLWVFDGRLEHGPFKTMLDASSVAVDIVTDHINSIPGVAVHFFDWRINQ